MSRRGRWALSGLVLLLLGGGLYHFSPRLIAAISRPANPAEVEAIAVTVLKDYFGHPDGFPQVPFTHYFVTIQDKDPTAAQIKALSGLFYTVSPGSNVKPDAPYTGEQFPTSISVGSIEVSPLGTASAKTKSWCGNLCGSGWTFYLRKTGDVWTITSKQMDWIS